MLVLSRKKNESIVINNDVTVTVVEIRGDKVRLGMTPLKEIRTAGFRRGPRPPTPPRRPAVCRRSP